MKKCTWSEAVVCLKGLILWHKVLQEGYPQAILQSVHHLNFLSQLNSHWLAKKEQALDTSQILCQYVSILVTKIQFHQNRPEFEGNLSLDTFLKSQSASQFLQNIYNENTVDQLLSFGSIVIVLLEFILAKLSPNTCKSAAVAPLLLEACNILQVASFIMVKLAYTVPQLFHSRIQNYLICAERLSMTHTMSKRLLNTPIQLPILLPNNLQILQATNPSVYTSPVSLIPTMVSLANQPQSQPVIKQTDFFGNSGDDLFGNSSFDPFANQTTSPPVVSVSAPQPQEQSFDPIPKEKTNVDLGLFSDSQTPFTPDTSLFEDKTVKQNTFDPFEATAELTLKERQEAMHKRSISDSLTQHSLMSVSQPNLRLASSQPVNNLLPPPPITSPTTKRGHRRSFSHNPK
eukprot:TRINITY_DN717_c0_g1_i1.p1 TRINITY_DN717_c0_g1~~TRINITY_DN717_c0_g1_i1.p1  ORF type:complete len:416 (+),score=91.94 TRINITY_DN717_c0_g1_i1:43-1248(+)